MNQLTLVGNEVSIAKQLEEFAGNNKYFLVEMFMPDSIKKTRISAESNRIEPISSGSQTVKGIHFIVIMRFGLDMNYERRLEQQEN